MTAASQNSTSVSETLKARKAHLTALLKVVDINVGKSTAMQQLTITEIKAEIGLIEHKLKQRR